ncbi:MAG: ABC transporter ATP-binding protein [Candidatus Hydrogenedentes bacterium]|nr:ABC transporter ATP-binding protein [Candidatus Hydrogenedentota bacterium]
MALIEIENLEVRYGDFQALNGVTCAIEEGVAVGLLGPNGAGKSTLMKTLLGFNRASAGSVKILGHEMPQSALRVRQELGYMPEREVVSPKVSAVSFLTYVGRLFGMIRVDAMERTHEVLNYVGLGENRYRKMETYSTGMLQRVKLAQALIHDPRLLLLDEPTNGLDPEGRQEMLDLIADIGRNRKVTVVLSSHLMPDVQHVCERVIMVQHGRIVEDGTIKELTAPRENQYEVQVNGGMESFLEALGKRGGQCIRHKDDLMLLQVPEGHGNEVLFLAAQEASTQIRRIEPAKSSLAEVFMKAMSAPAPTDKDAA